MLQVKQKYVPCLRMLVDMFTNPEDTALDPFSGSYNLFSAAMLLPLHLWCFLSDSDPACKMYGLQPLVDVFAGQLLNDTSDITGSD